MANTVLFSFVNIQIKCIRIGFYFLLEGHRDEMLILLLINSWWLVVEVMLFFPCGAPLFPPTPTPIFPGRSWRGGWQPVLTFSPGPRQCKPDSQPWHNFVPLHRSRSNTSFSAFSVTINTKTSFLSSLPSSPFSHKVAMVAFKCFYQIFFFPPLLERNCGAVSLESLCLPVCMD